MTIRELLFALILAIFGCTGFWTFLNNYVQSKSVAKTTERKALLGLLHENLVTKCSEYIERGHITKDEYEDLRRYIYEPYAALGGNGTGERLMGEVNKLPIK
jgi:hypothetical protein